jgi:hypothetical protein
LITRLWQPLNDRQGKRQRPRLRPCLEALEERMLLSAQTYVVDLAGDAGNGSGLSGDIRYCVNQANQPDNTGSSIIFDTMTSGTTITLTNGQLTIFDQMTITGPGASSLTLSGNNSSRLFGVASGGLLALQDVTLSDGLATGTGTAADGGAVYSSGALALIGVTVNSNAAVGTNGATGNVGASGGTGGDALGGGIYVANGIVTLINDTLSSNHANGGNGGNGGSGGGGVLGGTGGSGGTGWGGGLFVAGGTVTLINDTLSSNSAIGGHGGDGGFGATAASAAASAALPGMVWAAAYTSGEAPSS